MQTVVVEHRVRLTLFGCELGVEAVEAALAAPGRRLAVAELTEMKDDLVPDLVASYCARLDGRRSARSPAQKAVEAIRQ